MNPLSQIPAARRSLIIIGLVLIMAITFETFQQLYYIRRFDLAQGITFLDVVQGQSYRWLIWVLLSALLVRHARQKARKKELTFLDIAGYLLVILALVFVSIIIISVLQILMDGEGFVMAHLLNEYLPFFTFQKAPIYILGYIAISIILHLYFANEQLQIRVQELSDIKKTHQQLYNQLRSKMDDRAAVLNIKIGNKHRIIPVENISWVEADDYCVKVHTQNGDSYSMRSSLKALENKLEGNFLRVHRKAIVNMDMARELHLSQSPALRLANDVVIPVSKTNLKLVRDYLS